MSVVKSDAVKARCENNCSESILVIAIKKAYTVFKQKSGSVNLLSISCLIDPSQSNANV